MNNDALSGIAFALMITAYLAHVALATHGEGGQCAGAAREMAVKEGALPHASVPRLLPEAETACPD